MDYIQNGGVHVDMTCDLKHQIATEYIYSLATILFSK